MEFKGFFVLVVVGTAICCVLGKPTPRDSTVVKTQEVIGIETLSDSKIEVTTTEKSGEHRTTLKSQLLLNEKSPVITEQSDTIVTPRQVPCLYEEATEDLVCQELCLPKGYSYGLCVSNKCSCI